MNQTHACPADENALVSVMIPAYNHEDYVQQTIQSIIDQTYPNIEIIIVNDGSTDHTHDKITELLPRCEERFVHTKYKNKSNEGVIRNFNHCLQMTEGQYVYIIASDDLAESTAIEVLLRFLNTHSDYGLAVGDNLFIDSEGKRCFWGTDKKPVYNEAEAIALTHAAHLRRIRKDVDFDGPSFGSYQTLLGGNYVPNGYLIRADVLAKIGGYSSEAQMEDLHLMLQIAKHSKLKYIDQPLFHYRWHGDNLSHQQERMKACTQQTLQLEQAYAREHGFEKYIPIEKIFKIGRVKIAEYKKNSQWSYLRIFNKSCYSLRIKNQKKICRILGIKISQKPV